MPKHSGPPRGHRPQTPPPPLKQRPLPQIKTDPVVRSAISIIAQHSRDKYGYEVRVEVKAALAKKAEKEEGD